MMRHSELRRRLAHRGHAVLATCAALALPGLACGQLDSADSEETEETRRYTVEMIVFEYTDSSLSGNESFMPDEPPPSAVPVQSGPLTFGDPAAFSGPEVPVAIDDEIVPDEELEFLPPEEEPLDEELEELPSHIIHTQLEVLDPELSAMPKIYENLMTLGAYRPLMRAAWTQATFEKEQTLPITLRRLGNAPLRLDGTVMLYLSRYLHFVVDLTIESQDEQQPARYEDDDRNYGDRRSRSRFGFGYKPRLEPVTYTISEDRIFRNGELRYYDHPKFGVLARITRVEEDEPETDEMFLLPPEDTGL